MGLSSRRMKRLRLVGDIGSKISLVTSDTDDQADDDAKAKRSAKTKETK